MHIKTETKGNISGPSLEGVTAAMKTLNRVLLVYISRPPILHYLSTAFRKAGIETACVNADDNTRFDRWVIHPINKQLHNFRLLPKSRNLFVDHPLAHKNYRSNALKKAFSEFKPDLVLLIRGTAFDESVLKQISPLFGWWTEGEERGEEAIQELPLFDWYFFISRSSAEKAKKQGYNNTSYLEHAVDIEAFYSIPGIEKQYDACFVGKWSAKRQRLLEAALAVTPNIAVYGGTWLKKNWFRPTVRKCIKGSYIKGEKLVELYNQSRIVLNITNWGLGEGVNRSGMNMRIMEVPATGAFLLTDGSRELDEILEDGKHVSVYVDPGDFSSKLEYYLQNSGVRESIAKQGMEHVRQHYSYDTVVQRIRATFEFLHS